MTLGRLIAFCAIFALIPAANSEPLTIAAASNFARPARELAALFEESSGHPVRISTASTGKLYAQIENGAPFDVLLAADKKRPQLLEERGQGAAGTRFTYAVGHLVLWSRDMALVNVDCKAQLESPGKHRIAIANPLTAPYGAAAKEFLTHAGRWESLQSHLVYGENIAQTLHFVVSGNASLGLIARSQATDARLPEATCNWPVPESMHEPLEQQAILLRRAQDNRAAAGFLKFLRSAGAREVIVAHGYEVPD